MPAKITFLGDIMAEPPVLKAAKRRDSYDFSGVFALVKELLKDSEYVVGNLETSLAVADAGMERTLFLLPGQFQYEPSFLSGNAEKLDPLRLCPYLYVENKKIEKMTFSMLKNCILPDG